jgi:hypothetical protein
MTTAEGSHCIFNKADVDRHGIPRTRAVRAPRTSTAARFILGAAALAFAGQLTSCAVAPAPGGQKFTVLYEVSGTFDDCTVFYITRRNDVSPDEENEGGEVIQEDVALPWSHTFDVTVTTMRPFNTQIGAVCTSGTSEQVQATVSVNGVEEDTAQETGQNVNAQADFTLTVGG